MYSKDVVLLLVSSGVFDLIILKLTSVQQLLLFKKLGFVNLDILYLHKTSLSDVKEF